ncbi:hypothetical protein Hanom_Chr02g00162951 [Helianthus anomalus]
MPLNKNPSCNEYPCVGVTRQADHKPEKSGSSGYSVEKSSNASTRTWRDVNRARRLLRASATVLVTPDLCRITKEKSCKNSTHLAWRGLSLCWP